MAYLLIKSLHLLFDIGWMAAVFSLPRILVNLAEVGDEPAAQARLHQMGRRLYRFGHNVFGFAFVLGLLLWQGWRVFPIALPNVVGGLHWLDAKLVGVGLLLAHFIVAGRMLKRSVAGKPLPSARALRGFNALPALLLFGVIFLVIGKPF